MNRFVAMGIAIVMVVGAFVLRSGGRDGAVSPNVGTNTGSQVAASSSVEGLLVVCAPALQMMCGDSFGSQSAAISDAEVIDILTGRIDGPAPDVWITSESWVSIADDRLVDAGRPSLAGDRPVVATSPLVFVIDQARAATLVTSCGEITWKCIGDAAPQSWLALGGSERWGSVKPGHVRPDDIEGLAIIGAAAAGFHNDAAISSRDIRADEFLDWFSGLERAVSDFDPPSGSPLDAFVLRGPSAYDVVVTTEAQVRTTVEPSARAGSLSVVVTDPPATIALVLVGITDAGREFVQSAPSVSTPPGWNDPNSPDARPDGGLPPSGTLDALRTLWLEVTR